MKKKLDQLEDDIKTIENTIFSLNVNMERIERSLPQGKTGEIALVDELDALINELKRNGEARESIEIKQESIAESLKFVRRFVGVLTSYAESVKELQKNLSSLNELFKQFKKVIVGRHNDQTITIEKYRILSHLGEIDSKVLTLLMSGVKFENEFLEEISSIRRAILSDDAVDIAELQVRFNKLFREFADIFEDSSRQLSDYQKEAKKIVQNMRDVVWM